MLIEIPQEKIHENIPHLMRRLGYQVLQDRRTGREGYVRRLSAGFYPRFHAHLSPKDGGGLLLDLHFENYKPMHKRGTSRVENEGEVLEQEVQRIASLLA